MAARITAGDFDQKVIGASLPVLVDFYSDSCVACKKLSPVLGDIEDDYEDKLTVYKLNTSFDGAAAEKYGVLSNPTLVLFKDGAEAGRQVGAKTYDDLCDWIDEII